MFILYLGAASLIGKRTGKVIAFAARYKRCRICDVAKTQQRDPRQHTCRKNWKKSAKAMEPDMVVEMLKSTKEKKCHGDNTDRRRRFYCLQPCKS